MSKFATLGDLKRESEDAGGENYYAGGASEGGSGVSVAGGPADKVFSQRGVSDGNPTATVTIYKNGFTIDDNEFRSIEVPANRKFLEQIAEGKCPEELQQAEYGADVKVVDKRHVDYTPPAGAPAEFRGEGNSLGGSSQASEGVWFGRQGSDEAKVEVDDSKPKTTIMVRTINGKRLSIELNHQSRVKDLIDSVANATPTGTMFQLQNLGTFPPSMVKNHLATLEEAGLVDTQIRQVKASM